MCVEETCNLGCCYVGAQFPVLMCKQQFIYRIQNFFDGVIIEWIQRYQEIVTGKVEINNVRREATTDWIQVTVAAHGTPLLHPIYR